MEVSIKTRAFSWTMEAVTPESWIVKRPSDWSWSGNGDCVDASFLTWLKLRKIHSRRVRGKRGVKDDVHYWVEAKGYAYDYSVGQHLIAPLDEFYTELRIQDVEYADEGFFYKNNHTLGVGPDNTDNLKKALSDSGLPFAVVVDSKFP